MEIAFISKTIRQICEDAQCAQDQLGYEVARSLQNRLADLLAADCIYDIPGSKELYSEDTVLLELYNGCQLSITANHVCNPLTIHESIDWHKVTRVKVLSIKSENV